MATNCEGESVDPVPFLVVVGLAFMLVFSAAPFYVAYVVGVDLLTGFLVATALFLAVVAAAWYRFVWTYRPELLAEVPVERRLQRLYYGMIAFAVLLFGLTIPVW